MGVRGRGRERSGVVGRGVTGLEGCHLKMS